MLFLLPFHLLQINIYFNVHMLSPLLKYSDNTRFSVRINSPIVGLFSLVKRVPQAANLYKLSCQAIDLALDGGLGRDAFNSAADQLWQSSCTGSFRTILAHTAGALRCGENALGGAACMAPWLCAFLVARRSYAHLTANRHK